MKILPSFDLGFKAVQALATGSSKKGKERIHEIDKLLKSSKIKLVIMIDDMERADPVVIRKMFPVIDQLKEFERCSFLFGIDPERIIKAFSRFDNDSEDAKIEAKGFMDKVFDLQLELPSPKQHEIDQLATEWVDPNLFPKLAKALPHLSLPDNPRDLEKFLNRAKADEAMFLSHRYGDTEKNYKMLFTILMADTVIKDFITTLKHPKLYKKIEQLIDDSPFLDWREPSEEDENHKREFAKEISNEISSKIDRTEEILAIIHKLAQLNSYNWKDDAPARTELSWLLGDYKTPYLITNTEREYIQTHFDKHNGAISIIEKIDKKILRRNESSIAFLTYFIDETMSLIKGRDSSVVSNLSKLKDYLDQTPEIIKNDCAQKALGSRASEWITSSAIIQQDFESIFIETSTRYFELISTEEQIDQLLALVYRSHHLFLNSKKSIADCSATQAILDQLKTSVTRSLIRIFEKSENYREDFYNLKFGINDLESFYLQGKPPWATIEEFTNNLLNSTPQSTVAFDYLDALCGGWQKIEDSTVDAFFEQLKKLRDTSQFHQLITHLISCLSDERKEVMKNKTQFTLSKADKSKAWFKTTFKGLLDSD